MSRHCMNSARQGRRRIKRHLNVASAATANTLSPVTLIFNVEPFPPPQTHNRPIMPLSSIAVSTSSNSPLRQTRRPSTWEEESASPNEFSVGNKVNVGQILFNVELNVVLFGLYVLSFYSFKRQPNFALLFLS